MKLPGKIPSAEITSIGRGLTVLRFQEDSMTFQLQIPAKSPQWMRVGNYASIELVEQTAQPPNNDQNTLTVRGTVTHACSKSLMIDLQHMTGGNTTSDHAKFTSSHQNGYFEYDEIFIDQKVKLVVTGLSP